MLPLVPGLGPGLRLLCLGAHPDDIEIGAGGTVLQLIAGGWLMEASWVVFSGTPDRIREGNVAAEAFLGGVATRDIRFHDIPDGYFPSRSADVKDLFEELKASAPPDLVLTPRLNDAHQDHRVVAELAWNTFRDHLILEYEIPKYDGDLTTPNLYVPLDPVILDRKVSLIETCFPSQASRTWFGEETFRGLARIRGLEAGGDVRYAEAFHARKLALGIAGLT